MGDHVHAKLKYAGALVSNATTDVIAEFDELVADRGFDTAKRLVADESVRVVVSTPQGCSRPRAIMLIDLGELDNLGSGGWNDTEAAFGPRKGT